jgi:hypothetical protein
VSPVKLLQARAAILVEFQDAAERSDGAATARSYAPAAAPTLSMVELNSKFDEPIAPVAAPLAFDTETVNPLLHPRDF